MAGFWKGGGGGGARAGQGEGGGVLQGGEICWYLAIQTCHGKVFRPRSCVRSFVRSFVWSFVVLFFFS